MNYNYKTKEGKTVRVFYNEGFRDKEDFGTMSWFEGTDEDYREKEERIQKERTRRKTSLRTSMRSMQKIFVIH